MVLTVAILGRGDSGSWNGTQKDVKNALDSLGYNGVLVATDQNMAENLRALNPDLAFITNPGNSWSNGSIQGLLEVLGINYINCGLLTSAVGENKVMSKLLFQSVGIEVPEGYVVKREDILNDNIKMEYPFILKPIDEGGSKGLHSIFSHDDLLKLIRDPSDIREEMIIEKYIPGIDLTTAVLFDEALATLEVRSENSVYDYETKVQDGCSVEKVLALDIPPTVYKMTLDWALKAHRIIGCKNLSRSDFRYNPEDGSLKMLEINPVPILHVNGMISKMAKFSKGMEYNDLINAIIKDSL